MSSSEQHLNLGRGFSINPLFSIYSASMVGVFCALILMVESPLPALFALSALLVSYLLTCIFIFGSFRGFMRDNETREVSKFQLGLPSGFVFLFCLTSLAALFGTYSALDPISGERMQSAAHKSSGGITQRFKGSVVSEAPTISQPTVTAKPIRPAKNTKSAAFVPRAVNKAPDLTLNFDTPKPILASVRSDELVGARTIRSNAWAIRESSNLPVLLRLPDLLFGILYGDDNGPSVDANMVVAKRNTNSTARIMVSFLTSPQSSFKNFPAAQTGGIVVVQKRETVVALRQPTPAPVEPMTVIAKSEAPKQIVNSTATIARAVQPTVRAGPVGVASTKQDAQTVVRSVLQAKTASRTPGVLLPPVLASIFYGRPSAALDPSSGGQRAPRLTTLFKTGAPQAIQLTASNQVTVVSKNLSAAPARHPIAIAALADNHRIVGSHSDGLGGPYSRVTAEARAASKVMRPVADNDLVTGSISPVQINSAIRSLRFVPRFEDTGRQAENTREPREQNAKRDLGKVGAIAIDQGNGLSVDPQRVPLNPGSGPVTVILKKEASALPAAAKRKKLVLAALPSGKQTTRAFKLTSDKQDSSASAPEPASANTIKISGDGGTFAKQSGQAAPGKVKLNLTPAAPSVSARKAAKVPRKAPLSSAAMRKANEEIDSALRGAEADLKETDVMLDEIDVIWKDHDIKRQRSGVDTKARLVPAVKKSAVFINPASSTPGLRGDALNVQSKGASTAFVALPEPPVTQQATRSVKESVSRPTAPKQRLLGYIRERGSLSERNIFTDCAVVGLDSKLRSCSARPVTKQL